MARINFSRLYGLAERAHALVPFGLGTTFALPPFFVQIEVTHRCNAGCPVCYQKTKLDAGGEMSTGEIRRIIDQLPPWCVLSLTGGEPFMREDFAALLEYGMMKRRCTILTNGSLVTDAHIDLMVKNRLLLMAVSLDGIGETHDCVRKSAGLFDRAVETIRRVQERKRALNSAFPLIDIKSVILKENVGELGDILAVADRLSADFITFSVPRSMDSLYSAPYREDIREITGSLPPYPVLGDGELALLTEQIAGIRRYTGQTTVRFYPANMLDERSVERFYRRELSPDDFRACSLPWSRMSISPHGDVYPCLSYRVGNARTDSLARIWNGARFREFRSRLGRKGLSRFCLGCCNSVCRVRSA